MKVYELIIKQLRKYEQEYYTGKYNTAFSDISHLIADSLEMTEKGKLTLDEMDEILDEAQLFVKSAMKYHNKNIGDYIDKL